MTSQTDVWSTLALVGKAMGNGHRLAILDRLAQAPGSVEVLAEKCSLTIGNASQHLQFLRRTGLVTANRSGKQMIYRLTDERIVSLLILLRQVSETNLAEMERLVSQLFADQDADGALESLSRDELETRLKNGTVTLLDVRPEDEYRAGHLPTAIHAPLSQLDALMDQLPLDGEFVAYCRGPYCTFSHRAVQRLRERGFQARRLTDGVPEWKAAGLPVES